MPGWQFRGRADAIISSAPWRRAPQVHPTAAAVTSDAWVGVILDVAGTAGRLVNALAARGVLVLCGHEVFRTLFGGRLPPDPSQPPQSPPGLWNLLDQILSDLPASRHFFLRKGGQFWDTLCRHRARLCCVFEPLPGTFRRSADRNPRTRRRSAARPRGLDPQSADVQRDNWQVSWISATVQWAQERGHAAIVAHPSDSYLWPVMDSSDPSFPEATAEVDCTSCMFGSAHRGATRFRVFGDVDLDGLAKTCRRTPTGWSCGNHTHALCGTQPVPGLWLGYPYPRGLRSGGPPSSPGGRSHLQAALV